MSGVSLQKVKYNVSNQPNSSVKSSNRDMKISDTMKADDTFTRYSSEYPELTENFTLLINAVTTLKDNVTKQNFYSFPEVHKSVSTVNETYSKTSKYEFKKIQSEYLVDIGFVSVSKDMLLKLVDLCPKLLSYDREMDLSSDGTNKMVRKL